MFHYTACYREWTILSAMTGMSSGMTTKVRLDAAGRERETLASVAYEKLRHEIITVAL